MFGSFNCSSTAFEKVLQEIIDDVPEVLPEAVDEWDLENEDIGPEDFQVDADDLEVADEPLPIELEEIEKEAIPELVLPTTVDITQTDDVVPDNDEQDEPIAPPTIPERDESEDIDQPDLTIRREESNAIKSGPREAVDGTPAPAVAQDGLRGRDDSAAGNGFGGGDIKVVNFGGGGNVSGGIICRRMTAQKQGFADWILKNPCDLSQVVRNSLQFDLNKDHTAKNHIQDETGATYLMYFLYRPQTNLFRVLVVKGTEAFQIDMPFVDSEAEYVQTGEVSFTQTDGQQTIYMISLQPVEKVTQEVHEIMDYVLRWLEIADEN